MSKLLWSRIINKIYLCLSPKRLHKDGMLFFE